jgi:hydroxypyruvate reductase
VLEAAHPVPDTAGEEATQRIIELVQGLTYDDLVVCLLSGGGSALLEAPPTGISLPDMQAVSRALLKSGASISEINCVRKHVSLVKGGRLAAVAHPARIVTYIVSDVPGDDPSVVASGPTVPDSTTFTDALAVLELYGIMEPSSVLLHLKAGAAADDVETPKPGDPAFARDEVVVLATAHAAIDAAAAAATAAGVSPVILGYDLEGEARDLGREHAELTRACATGRGPAAPPCVLLSGGETTVTVTGRGRGGRNTEYLLGLALGLRDAPRISAVAADTDGIDGTEDNAGAFLLHDTLERARAAGFDAEAAQAANDAYGFFAAAGDLLVTGPTRTNVNDLRAVLVQAP